MREPEKPLHLFEGYGVELEYMIVHADTLRVMPVADEVLKAEAGIITNDVERGSMAWSNELVLHVMELKTNGPAENLKSLPENFLGEIRYINGLLKAFDGMLLPGGMHPLMDPLQETRLWPHANSEIYESYDRIFGCRGHGWANLQSVHLNLPFCGDEEFGKLHAALRVILPILPGLAASTPLMEGRKAGFMDTRLEVYRLNQKKIPVITGEVIPEAVYTRRDYERSVLEPIASGIQPFDTEGILEAEWLNSRGAIARFDRNTIEIRLMDIQECPLADLAVITAVVAAARALVSGRWVDIHLLQQQSTRDLKQILLQVLKEGEEALIKDRNYLRMFGLEGERSLSCRDLWEHLIGALLTDTSETDRGILNALKTILREGTLARRILRSLGDSFGTRDIHRVYRQMGDCLNRGEMFVG